MSAELATLAADPSRVRDVAPDALPALIGEVEALKALLWARLQTGQSAANPAPAPSAKHPADELLTAKEAAARLGVSRRWIYRKAKANALPFARRLATGTLRFSARGLDHWRDLRR